MPYRAFKTAIELGNFGETKHNRSFRIFTRNVTSEIRINHFVFATYPENRHRLNKQARKKDSSFLVGGTMLIYAIILLHMLHRLELN